MNKIYRKKEIKKDMINNNNSHKKKKLQYSVNSRIIFSHQNWREEKVKNENTFVDRDLGEVLMRLGGGRGILGRSSRSVEAKEVRESVELGPEVAGG